MSGRAAGAPEPNVHAKPTSGSQLVVRAHPAEAKRGRAARRAGLEPGASRYGEHRVPSRQRRFRAQFGVDESQVRKEGQNRSRGLRRKGRQVEIRKRQLQPRHRIGAPSTPFRRIMSLSALFLFALLTIYLGLFASLLPSADSLRRLTRFLFGLFAIADLVS